MEVIAEVPQIADSNGIPLTPFDGRANRISANGSFHDLVDVLDPQAITSRSLAISSEIKEVASRRAFRKDTPGIGQIGQGSFDSNANPLDAFQAWTQDFDTANRAQTGGQHLSPWLD